MPRSASPAPVTRPTYPVPTMQMFIKGGLSRRAAPPQELPLPPGEGRGEGVTSRRPAVRARRPHPAFDPRAVSEFTATRLSIYVRCLAALEAEGARHVSSQHFARRFDLNSAQ